MYREQAYLSILGADNYISQHARRDVTASFSAFVPAHSGSLAASRSGMCASVDVGSVYVYVGRLTTKESLSFKPEPPLTLTGYSPPRRTYSSTTLLEASFGQFSPLFMIQHLYLPSSSSSSSSRAGWANLLSWHRHRRLWWLVVEKSRPATVELGPAAVS